MPEIVRCYRQNMTAHRLIGIKYGDDDRVDGSFGDRWRDWFEHERFDSLETAVADGLKKLGESYDDNNAYLGFMRVGPDLPFEYWIGLFVAPNTPVPEGFDSLDCPAGEMGVCWIHGKESAGLYGMHDACVHKAEENSFVIRRDFGSGEEYRFFERYACPRFTETDGDGNVILDYAFYIE